MAETLFSRKYLPFAAQSEIVNAPQRFISLCTGRRFGKTATGVFRLVHHLWGDPGDYAWIAPTYSVTQRGIDEMSQIINPKAYRLKGNPPVAHWANGARTAYLSADSDDPVSLLGWGFKGGVIDEAARIRQKAWQQNIRPTFSDKQGWVLFMSTPKGRNWFYDMFARGNDPNFPDYLSKTYRSIDSPYFPEQEWDDAKRDLADSLFRQEYMAEFLADSAGVFNNIDQCRVLTERCSCDGMVVIGIDVAKHTDFTVMIAMCQRCGHCFAIDRFQRLDWTAQKQRIATFVGKHNGNVLIDASGVGDPIFDDLKAAGMRIQPFLFTSSSKQMLVQELMLAIEQGAISWPNAGEDWDILTAELRRYEYEYTKSRAIRYSAPEGYHDDCVVSLSLATHLRGSVLHPTVMGGGVPTELDNNIAELRNLLHNADSPEERAAIQQVINDAEISLW
jgi:hypothetical protein